ncbi:MAG: hypothetical protein ACOVNY_03865 [Chitinophagaceae bacterium]
MIAIKVYRIITYILLPFAALFSLIALFTLLVALANPQLFLPLFLMICVVLYVFGSFNFLQKAIIKMQECKPFLRDFITVNAIVATVFAASGILQFIQLNMNPAIMHKTLEQAMAMQQPNAPANVLPMMHSIMSVTLYIILVLSILLLVHIFLSFRLMKSFKHAFTKN